MKWTVRVIVIMHMLEYDLYIRYHFEKPPIEKCKLIFKAIKVQPIQLFASVGLWWKHAFFPPVLPCVCVCVMGGGGVIYHGITLYKNYLKYDLRGIRTGAPKKGLHGKVVL